MLEERRTRWFGARLREVARKEVDIDVSPAGVSRALTRIAIKTSDSHDFMCLMFRADLELSSRELHVTFLEHNRVLEKRECAPALRALHSGSADSGESRKFERRAKRSNP